MAAEGRLITLVFGDKHAITTAVVSGAPTDSDFVRTPPDGTIAVDGSSSAPRLWIRANGTWLELDDLTTEVADLIVDMAAVEGRLDTLETAEPFIASVSGGVTTDVQARSTIDEIRTLLINKGFMESA